ncbi:MAG: beta-propeller fold lactonase family protein [Planctomycetota bacterium]
MSAKNTTFGLLPLATLALAVTVPAQQSFTAGAVYTMTNEASGNRVAVFDRATDGVVTFNGYVPTQGLGTDAGLGNQGGLILTDDERFLLVCNAGSHDISVFAVGESSLTLVDRAPTRGLEPVSIAQHDQLVYVVNDVSSSIAGFELRDDGALVPLRRSVRPLSADVTDPAQISFSPNGRFLYVTEKATNVIDQFRVGRDGTPIGLRQSIPSANTTPFGFAFGMRNQLFLSEAGAGMPGQGTVSSYDVGPLGSLNGLTTAVATGETATCWVVGTPSGRLIYASNTGSDSVSSFRVDFDGSLQLLDAQAATTGDRPLDMAVSNDGLFFYVLNAGAGSIGDYRIEPNGALASLPGTNSGLPASASGLAAR